MNPAEQDQEQTPLSGRFLIIVSVFIACLMTSNVISVKLISVFGWVMPAGVIVFPLSYIAGDVLTEVYGYRQARRVIWLGFLSNTIMVVAIRVGELLPPPVFWDGQGAYEKILGYTPRLLIASLLAYLIGEFANSIVLAKMKIATRGRWLWMRTIGSTVVGEGLDSLVFIVAAFSGIVPPGTLASAVLTQWVVKTGYEVIATPVTYAVVRSLKRKEKIDVYDDGTRFNPLHIS
jgi:queuosine precursor transporter